MTRINVNLDDVQSNQFDLFPEGFHAVEILPSSKLGQSEGGAFILWLAKCTEGDMEDKMIGWRTYLTPASLWNLKNMLEVMGYEWEDEGFDLEDLFGEALLIKVTHQEYPSGSGEYRNQISGYAGM